MKNTMEWVHVYTATLQTILKEIKNYTILIFATVVLETIMVLVLLMQGS